MLSAYTDVIHFLKACQASSGGFGGGPLQLPHLATNYAAVAALVTIGGEDALNAVDRPGMLNFVRRMCRKPEAGGGFSVCEGKQALRMLLALPLVNLLEHCPHGNSLVMAGGEVDCRGCYTAVAVLHMLELDKTEAITRSGMVDFIRRCQVIILIAVRAPITTQRRYLGA